MIGCQRYSMNGLFGGQTPSMAHTLAARPSGGYYIPRVIQALKARYQKVSFLRLD
mgnify:CR=1 FL=1